MRLGKLNILNVPIEKRKQLLGEVKAGLYSDCVYNNIIQGEYDDWQEPCVDLNKVLDKDVLSYLKEHQKKDLSKALGLSYVFNINKPGSGKTLETILWIKYILKKNFKALILCPKSVKSTWENQLNKYWPTWYKDGTWWITNYEQLYEEERFNIASTMDWDIIVLDESHNIKSFKSKITNIVLKLKSTNRHCLTGTPIKNRPEDLAAQLKFLDPYSITNFTDFEMAFCNLIRDKWGWHPKGLTKDQTMVNNLQKLLNMYCVGGQDIDLGCEPNYIKVRLKLDDKVKTLYRKIEGEYDKELKQRIIDTAGLLDEGIKVSSAIESATRRQQLTSNCQLFNDNLHNVKFEWIKDWLDGTDEKVLIFSKYAQTIEKLKKYLKGYNVFSIERKMKPEEREFTKQQWIKRGQVLMGTYGVLAEGIDGLQDVCRYCIFIDRAWNASDNEQAEGRIIRTGQKRQPVIYILQAIGTIDILIERTQLDKGADAENLLRFVSDEEE